MDVEKHYALEAGQIIRRVPPPFIPERMDLYRRRTPQGQLIAQPQGSYAMLLHHRPDQLTIWGQAFGVGTGFTLEELIEFTLSVYRSAVETEAWLLRLELPGDIVVDPTASEAQYLKAIEDVASEVLSNGRVAMEFREVEQMIDVLHGKWNYQPIDVGASSRVCLEIYGQDLNSDRNIGGGGSGNLQEFAGWLGRWIGSEVLIEGDGLPSRLSWHLNDLGDGSEKSRALAHDPELVLEHIQDQTGLTWSKEVRKVRHLFIQQINP